MVRHGRLKEHPGWVMILVKINHLLLTINSAANIIIYSYKVSNTVLMASTDEDSASCPCCSREKLPTTVSNTDLITLHTSSRTSSSAP
jgi:hypothetical protein